jgi:hypothetical protein
MTIHTEKFWERKLKKRCNSYCKSFHDKAAYNSPAYKNKNQLEFNLGEICKKELTPILENIKKSEIIKK